MYCRALLIVKLIFSSSGVLLCNMSIPPERVRSLNNEIHYSYVRGRGKYSRAWR